MQEMCNVLVLSNCVETLRCMQKKGLMHVHALLHYRVSEAEGKIPKNVNFNSVQSIILADGEIL
jgi:hypothetical protein